MEKDFVNDSKHKLDFLLKGIIQICLIVKDIEKTVENYWGLFGIGPWQFYTYGKPLVKRMTRNGKPTEYKMRIALANIGSLRIELIQPLEGDTVYSEFVQKHGYGVHHVGVLVNNMEDAVKKANKAGLVVTQDGGGFGLDDDGHYAYLDTEKFISTTIELIERPRRRHQPDKVFPLPDKKKE